MIHILGIPYLWTLRLLPMFTITWLRATSVLCTCTKVWCIWSMPLSLAGTMFPRILTAVDSHELWFEGQNKAAAWPGTHSSHRSPPSVSILQTRYMDSSQKKASVSLWVIPVTNTKPFQWWESREGTGLSSRVPFYPYTFSTFYVSHVFPNHLFCWLRLQQ